MLSLRSIRKLTPPEQGSIIVAFVVSENTEPIDLVGPWQVFKDAYVPERGKLVEETHPFKMYTVSGSTDIIRAGRGLRIKPNFAFKDAPSPRIIVVPAQRGRSEAMMDWIREKGKTCDVIMSVCTGSFILGEAGLLDGLEATTHHEFLDTFSSRFSNVKVRRGLRFVENDRVSTSGGLSSGIDLALRIVERYFGREVATRTADWMEYQGKDWMLELEIQPVLAE
jgi:transcriptional regulator GlxA family with amidase domain